MGAPAVSFRGRPDRQPAATLDEGPARAEYAGDCLAAEARLADSEQSPQLIDGHASLAQDGRQCSRAYLVMQRHTITMRGGDT